MVSGQRRKSNSEREREWLMGGKLVLMRFMQQVFSTRVLATVQIVTEIVLHCAALLMRSYDKTG